MKFEVVDKRLKSSGTWAKSRKGAIRQSIQKWKSIVKNLETHQYVPDDGQGDTCSLCNLRRQQDLAPGVCVCPVKDMTHQNGCIGTPYLLYASAVENHDDALRAARAEVLFLEAVYALEK